MFRGSYEHTIDLKGRLSIPSRFREELSKREVNTLVLTAGDRCIWAFPMDEWERLEERLRQPPHFSPEMRHVLRMLVGSAKDCPVDRVGRTLVPPELREFAGLERHVTIVGQLDQFEIWNRERFVSYAQDQRGRFDEMTGKLSELRTGL